LRVQRGEKAKSAAEKLEDSAQELKAILDWRAWTDDEALQVLLWIEANDHPATAEAVLLEHARLEREVNDLRNVLDSQRQNLNALEEASDTRAILEDAEQRFEHHQAIYYEYAPLFPHILDSVADA